MRSAGSKNLERCYWGSKMSRNQARDVAAIKELRKLGWRAVVVWECELRGVADLEKRLLRRLAELKIKRQALLRRRAR
jgi:DNA mismatch endonuclease (patch repair protein)